MSCSLTHSIHFVHLPRAFSNHLEGCARFLLLTRKLIVRKWMYCIELQYVSKAHVYNLKSLNNRTNLYTMPEATLKKLPISLSVLTQVAQVQCTCERHNQHTLQEFNSN